MRTIRLEEMNTKSFVEAGFDTAIVPIGSCESHGDHMPFGTDGITAHVLAVKIAERLRKTFVLPPNFLGMSEHYRHKPLCISISSDTQIRILSDVLSSLRHWGIKKVLILNGHDGNIPSAEIAARDVKVANPEMSLAIINWWTVLAKMLPADTFEVWSGWGHGGEIETSIGLELFPELMNMKEARGMVPEVDQFVTEIWIFDEVTQHGASGAPQRGTKEKGELIVQGFLDYMVPYMQRFEDRGLVYNPKEAD